MKNFLKTGFVRFVRDEEGASAIEYALLVAMVALVLVLVMTDVQDAVKGIFDGIVTALTTSNP